MTVQVRRRVCRSRLAASVPVAVLALAGTCWAPDKRADRPLWLEAIGEVLQALKATKPASKTLLVKRRRYIMETSSGLKLERTPMVMLNFKFDCAMAHTVKLQSAVGPGCTLSH